MKLLVALLFVQWTFACMSKGDESSSDDSRANSNVNDSGQGSDELEEPRFQLTYGSTELTEGVATNLKITSDQTTITEFRFSIIVESMDSQFSIEQDLSDIVFPIGATEVEVPITIADDSLFDLNGSVSFTLSGDSTASIDTQSLTIPIRDNENCANHAGWTAYNEYGDGTAENPHVICTAAQLASMAAFSGNYTPECFLHYALHSDIDLMAFYSGGGSEFRICIDNTSVFPGDPIGFGGSFEGNGYTIDGYTYSTATDVRVGLFAALNGNAWVRNINLTNVNVQGDNRVGGLFGSSIASLSEQGPSLVNITVTGQVVGSGNNVGGVGGLYEYGCHNSPSNVVTNVTVNATVQGGGLVGGAFGDLNCTSGSRGEAIGLKVTASVTGTGNYIGVVSGSGARTNWRRVTVLSGSSASTPGLGVGGLTGDEDWGLAEDIRISATINSGGAAGGIFGDADHKTITRALFEGTVEGVDQVGGLVGHLDDSISLIENSVTSSEVRGQGANVGAIVGQLSNSAPAPVRTYAISSKWCDSNKSTSGVEDACNALNTNFYANESELFSPNSEPYQLNGSPVWDFQQVWQSSSSTLPFLRETP